MNMIRLNDLLKNILNERIESNDFFHEIIKIESFINPEDGKEVELRPFYLIFGSSSLDIFDFFETNEIAGLKRKDCVKFLNKNESEINDAFIAGLTNVYKGNLFLFLNLERLKGLSKESLVSHECLHLTRYLITFWKKEVNLEKDNWWKKTKFVKLKDSNEELFSEVLERCVGVVSDKLKRYL